MGTIRSLVRTHAQTLCFQVLTPQEHPGIGDRQEDQQMRQTQWAAQGSIFELPAKGLQVAEGLVNGHAQDIIPATQGGVIGHQRPWLLGLFAPQDPYMRLDPPAPLEDPFHWRRNFDRVPRPGRRR